MWIVREVSGCYHMERGHIVDNDCDKLEDVDGDESSVFVVGFEHQCPKLDLLGEVNVPPEAQFNGVDTCSFKADGSECCCSWCAWYQVGNWSLPENCRLWI